MHWIEVTVMNKNNELIVVITCDKLTECFCVKKKWFSFQFLQHAEEKQNFERAQQDLAGIQARVERQRAENRARKNFKLFKPRGYGVLKHLQVFASICIHLYSDSSAIVVVVSNHRK